MAAESPYRIYFKGLIDLDQKMKNKKEKRKPGLVAGIGFAICNSDGELVSGLSKPLTEAAGCLKKIDEASVELMALIEALKAALQLQLNLKRVTLFVDFFCFQKHNLFPISRYFPQQQQHNNSVHALFQKVASKSLPRNSKTLILIKQIGPLMDRFTKLSLFFIPQRDIHFAFDFATYAVESQQSTAGPPALRDKVFPIRACYVCRKGFHISNLFWYDNCWHYYCIPCIKQYAEAKLRQGGLPTCPHPSGCCHTQPNIRTFAQFVTPELINLMRDQFKELSLPAPMKLYCPHPTCSTLMSRSEVVKLSKANYALEESQLFCTSCCRPFCGVCMVSWHVGMTCFEYQKLHQAETSELKLATLAHENRWRQCRVCGHMIERLEYGCQRVTCRCGYQFCFLCGMNKTPCCCTVNGESFVLQHWDDEKLLRMKRAEGMNRHRARMIRDKYRDIYERVFY